MGYPDARAAKDHLDRLIGDADFVPGFTDDLETARRRFLNAGGELLEEALPWLWRYYLDERRTATDALQLGGPEEIWAHLTFLTPPEIRPGGDSPVRPHGSYVSFEGEVAWEPEHGLQLVFADGRELCKVGPYDGHLTHAAAYGDLDLLGQIYR